MRIKQLHLYVLSFCLLSPTLFDLIRKFIPDQPNYIVAVGTSIIITATLLFSLRFSRKKMPSTTKNLLFIILGLFLFYALLSLFISPFLPVLVILSRLCPILLAIATFKLIQSIDDLKSMIYTVSVIPILLVPSAIISMILGNDALPFFLKPVERIYNIGGNIRAGFDICSSVYATGAIMSISVLGISILTLSLLLSKAGKAKKYLLLSVMSSALLIFASTRRGALIEFACLICLNMICNKVNIKNLIAAISCLLILLYINDRSTAVENETFSKRSDFASNSLTELPNRINDIFFGIGLYWCNKTPWGTYLGYGEREAQMLHIPMPDFPIETGASQLISETGMPGLIIWTSSIVFIMFSICRRSRDHPERKVIIMLLAGEICLFIQYFFKEIATLNGLYTSELVFWMIPGICEFLLGKTAYRVAM